MSWEEMSTLKNRLKKLEATQPEINSLSHLSDEELEKRLKAIQKKAAESDCPNYIEWTTSRECKELHRKCKEVEERLAVI